MSDSDQPLSTQRTSQFNLRTLLMLFFCLAVGLTIGTSPPAESDEFGLSSGVYWPQLNWHYGLLAAGSLLIISGLIAQAIYLHRMGKTATNHRFDFAYQFAVLWRIGIATILLSCLGTQFLVAREFIELPEEVIGFWYGPVFPGQVWRLSIIVVLGSSVMRWQTQKSDIHRSGWSVTLTCLISITLAFIVLHEIAYVHYLVHVAIAGVEVSQAMRFQRQDAFLQNNTEELCFFLASLLGVVSVILGAALAFVCVKRSDLTLFLRRGLATIAVSFLAIAGIYGVWYYAYGLPMASPDMAVAGNVATWFEILGVIPFAGIAVTVVAYRLSIVRAGNTEGQHLRIDLPIFLHESLIACVLFLISTGVYLVEDVRSLYSVQNFWNTLFNWSTLFNLTNPIFSLLYDINAYSVIAIILLSTQLIWLRWKNQRVTLPVVLDSVSPSQLAKNWVLVLIVGAIGIPVISAFIFSFWLGPWYLW